MAHFAEIDSNNIVVRVLVVDNEHERNGQTYLADELGLGGVWVQTSYNTLGGVHQLGGTPMRKNYAGLGYIYDHVRDAFYRPQPFPSWVLDEETCFWQAPVPMPTDGTYFWNEVSQAWEAVTPEI
jgi:hypothetical protein